MTSAGRRSSADCSSYDGSYMRIEKWLSAPYAIGMSLMWMGTGMRVGLICGPLGISINTSFSHCRNAMWSLGSMEATFPRSSFEVSFEKAQYRNELGLYLEATNLGIICVGLLDDVWDAAIMRIFVWYFEFLPERFQFYRKN
jgi:hypothetical protein